MRITLIILFLIFCLSNPTFCQDPNLLTPDKVDSLGGTRFPNFVGVSLKGDSIFLDNKVTLISFISFPCLSCLMFEVPYLNQFEAEHGDEIQIVTIIPHAASNIKIYQENTDTTSAYCMIRRINNLPQIEYTIIPECWESKIKDKRRIGVDCEDISKQYVSEYPTNLLVDNQGIIRKVYTAFDLIVDKSIMGTMKEDALYYFNLSKQEASKAIQPAETVIKH